MRETIRPTRLQRERRANQHIQPLVPSAEKPKRKLGEYLKYAPLGYLFLVVFSSVGLNAYYSVFGVNILGYMSIQEVLLSPLDNGWIILRFLFYTIASLFSLKWLMKFLSRFLWTQRLPISAKEELTIFNCFALFALLTSYSSVRIKYGFDLNQILNQLHEFKSINFFVITGFLMVIFGMVLAVRRSIDMIKFYPTYLYTFWVLSISSIAVFSNYLFSNSRAHQKLDGKFDKVEISLKQGKKAISKQNYIGETNSIIFTWDSVKQVTNGYLKSEILSIAYYQLPTKGNVKPAKNSQVIPAKEQEKFKDLDEDCKANDPDCPGHIP